MTAEVASWPPLQRLYHRKQYREVEERKSGLGIRNSATERPETGSGVLQTSMISATAMPNTLWHPKNSFGALLL